LSGPRHHSIRPGEISCKSQEVDLRARDGRCIWMIPNQALQMFAAISTTTIDAFMRTGIYGGFRQVLSPANRVLTVPRGRTSAPKNRRDVALFVVPPPIGRAKEAELLGFPAGTL
jgi:hypothetical protein